MVIVVRMTSGIGIIKKDVNDAIFDLLGVPGASAVILKRRPRRPENVRYLPLVALSVLGLVAPATADEADRRELVVLPAMMQEHLLANMRDHLHAIEQIQEALSEGRFDAAGQIAEEQLGMSSLAFHGAAHMAPYMPKAMQAFGTQMHRAASQFALVAQDTAVDRQWARALESLAAVTRQCVACHATYRIR